MARSKTFNGSNASVVEIMKDVARTYGRTETAKTLASKHGVKSARIQAYATGLRAMGVDVAKIRRTGMYLRAVDELRKSDPQLFADSKQTAKKRGRPAKVK